MVRIYKGVRKWMRIGRWANFAMLHNVKLPEPSLIEWIACGVDNMTKTILFS